jgi:hypothetical protein
MVVSVRQFLILDSSRGNCQDDKIFVTWNLISSIHLQVYSPSPDDFGQDSPRYTSPKPDSYYIGKYQNHSVPLSNFIVRPKRG